MEQLRYEPRARFCGNVEWLCPYCGTMNKNRLDYTSWKFECRGKNCSRRFHLGLVFHAHTRQNMGRPTGSPCDYAIPQPVESRCDPFPVVELKEWQRRRPTHSLVDDETGSE
jgi:hypothetical protein